MNSVSFFLGANTPNGFYSLFNELYFPEDNWKMYIIKGGPGTGKSSIMKNIAKYSDNKGYFTERIYCSSDPDSLDAVIIPDLRVAIADGTSPHTIEPRFPGVCETIINLGDYWKRDKLKANANEIIRATKINSSHHKQCVRYLKAVNIINKEITDVIRSTFNKEKADRFIERIKKDVLIKTDNDNKAIKKRFLSSITPEGVYVNYNSILSLCNKTICIKDEYLTASGYIINKLSEIITDSGIDIIQCLNPLNPESVEHIILPNAGICIFTSDSYHPAILNNNQNINCNRFYSADKIKESKNRVVFLKKTRDEFINEAVNCLKNAKKSHDILESYYISAMDFSKIPEVENNIIKDIF